MTDAFGLVRSTESNPNRVRPAGISTGRASTKGVCLNYYQFHIGDFRSGTVNMSRQSRWLYRDMLDVYYDTESALPLDLDVLCDSLGVESADDRAIVERLLRFKFERTDEGFRHATCDRVIAEYHSKAQTARSNGKLGGRPKKADGNPEKPSGFQSGSNPPPGSEANQEPLTNNHLIHSPTGLFESAPADPTPSKAHRIPCPAEKLLEAFHEECPMLPRVMKLNDKRKAHLTARWREVDADSKFSSQADGVQVFRSIFQKVAASDFLAGRAKSWHATFDWIFESSTNFLKVCEGHYDNEGRKQQQQRDYI